MTTELGLPLFVCTIGPASRDPEVVRALVDAGMTVARVNGSHGSLADIRQLLTHLRTLLPDSVALLLDLPGNKVRTKGLANPMRLEAGARARLPRDCVTEPAFLRTVEIGSRISAADGTIQLLVVERDVEGLTLEVLVGGSLGNGKGLNVAGLQAHLPFDPHRDLELLDLAVEMSVDLVGLSFVRRSEHVRRAKSHLLLSKTRVVAKIETRAAIDDLEAILKEADLVMIDRGDLEAEIGREEVPLAVRRVLSRAAKRGVPAIVASQFLSSMLTRPLPTMAEVSDLHHALGDGATGLMLSEETAIGEFPIRCVEVLRDVTRAAKSHAHRDLDVVILSAGASTGFGSLTTHKHKCMLDVGGTTIIAHQLNRLRDCGIPDDRITVVTGHNHRQLEHYLRAEGFGGTFRHNPWFMTTNILASLWLARPDAGLLLVYGDIVFHPGILRDVLDSEASAALAVDFGSELSPEDEKVAVTNGKIVRGSKELNPPEAVGEFLGLARFDRAAAEALFEELDEVVRDGGLLEFLTVTFERLTRRGVVLTPVATAGRPWNDNDTLADLARSRELVYPLIRSAESHRFGRGSQES